MTKYVALLRGINVGGNNKVEMAKLKKVFEAEPLYFSNVRTYINSGNIIFETNPKTNAKTTNIAVKDGSMASNSKGSQALIQMIEKSLYSAFGFNIRVVLRQDKSIQKLCEKLPKNWTNDREQKTDILFLWDEYGSEKTLNLIKTTTVDTLKYFKEAGAIAWNVKRKDYNKSGLHEFIGTHVYKNMTARNINTVRKLGELMG